MMTKITKTLPKPGTWQPAPWAFPLDDAYPSDLEYMQRLEEKVRQLEAR